MYKKILVMTLLVVALFASSTCWATGYFTPEAKKDFVALGVEPFWSVHFFTDEAIVFSTPEGSIGFTYTKPVVKGKEYTYHLMNKVLKDRDLHMKIVIREEETSDTMSGMLYPYAVKIDFAGTKYDGVAYSESKPIKGDCVQI